MTGKTDAAKTVSKIDAMGKYRAEIERMVYAAEQLCANSDFPVCQGFCAFCEMVSYDRDSPPEESCGLKKFRELLGDCVIQHDTEEK